ncbi:MAG: AAA family ATPase [Fimbriimonas sp.]
MRSRPANREPFLHSIFLQRDEVPSFDRYPFDIPAIREMGRLPLHPAVTFFVGENGSGKSTLIEAMAARLGLDERGGERKNRFAMRSPEGALYDALRIEDHRYRRPADRYFMRAETVFHLANDLDELLPDDPSAYDAYGGRSLHSRSHGEVFLSIVQNRMRSESLFLLDEPEAALSPTRQFTLLKEIDWLVRSGSQFVIATHSPILLAYPDAIIYELGEFGVRETTWRETDHYTLTRAFLEKPDSFLRHLIE